MALRRQHWLPKFNPSAEFVVLKNANPIAGRRYAYEESFDKASVAPSKLKQLYENRIIGAKLSPSDEAALDRDKRRQRRGDRIVEAKPLELLPAKSIETIDETNSNSEDFVNNFEEQGSGEGSGSSGENVQVEGQDTVQRLAAELTPAEKEELLLEATRKEAREAGVDVDNRWGIERLNEEVRLAKRRAADTERKQRTGKKRGKKKRG